MDALLKASGISFAYGDRAALRDVSLSLDAGQLVAIIGPNGSGKSTLIRALLGIHRTSGTIDWQDRPIRSWRRRDLAQRVAYLPQTPSADVEQSVADVLRLGRAPYWRAFGIESEQDEKIVADVAALLDLRDLLSRRLDELSGGQRQRVFVGRCLVQQPIAMLLDEPSTYLDLKHQVELLQLLRRLREQNLAVLMASHDVNLAGAFAQRIVLLDGGNVVADGPPSKVLDADVLSRVYGLSLRSIPAGRDTLIFPTID